MTTITNVSCKYGAPMGRRGNPGIPGKCYLRRVRLDGGGYDRGGAYWGLGQPLFEVYSDDFSDYLRAPSRAAAKRELQEAYGADISFYR